MQMFKILDPFFHALSDGKLIRLTVAWVLRILAIITALIGLLGFIAIVGFAFKASEGGMGTRTAGILIGGVLLALFALAWGYLSAGILVFRANSVEQLGDSHFTVLSILSLLFRLNGELMFVLYSLLGIGGCLFVWFTDFSPFSELGMLGEEIPFASHAGTGFLGGIEFAIVFVLIAFAGIVFSYALAELSVVLVEIALNTRGLRTTSTPTAGILVFRAASVQELGDSHFTVLSILSLLFRLNGELMFVMYSLLGVGGCLFVWFTDASPLSELGMLGEEIPFAGHASTGFLGGIELAIFCLLIAFAGIVFSYAFAELSVVLVEIALNTRGLVNTSTPAAAVLAPALPAVTAPVPPPPAAPVPITPPPPVRVVEPPAPIQRKCAKCGQILDEGSTFCGECGTPAN